MVSPLFFLFALMICAGGLFIGKSEHWSRSDALYYAFITATTVGYGDFRPLKRLNKLIAVIIAFTGLVFTGLFVSLALHAATYAFDKTYDKEEVKTVLEELSE